MTTTTSPPLEGRKALVLGIANQHSIAYGCARTFRELGADLAITYLNDKARPYVEPAARELSLFPRSRFGLPEEVPLLASGDNSGKAECQRQAVDDDHCDSGYNDGQDHYRL